MTNLFNRAGRMAIGSMVLLLILIGQVAAQNISRSHLHTHPTLPEPERLARHNLVVQWTAQLPTFNMKDAIHDIHVLGVSEDHSSEQLLVQLKSGTVALFDAESGKQLWLANPEFSYQVVWPVTWNRHSIFCQAKNTLYAFERETGRLQFKQQIPDIQSAPPLASDIHMFISDERGYLKGYELPPFDRTGVRYRNLALLRDRDRRRAELLKPAVEPKADPEKQQEMPKDKDAEMPKDKDAAEPKEEMPAAKAPPKADPGRPDRMRDEANAPVSRNNPADARYMALNDEPNMVPVWSAAVGQPISFRPIQGENSLFVALNLLPENLAFGSSLANNLTGVQGGAFTLDKAERNGRPAEITGDPVPNTPFLVTRGKFVAPPTRFQNIAYVADDIGTITAWGIETNGQAWRANIGGPVNRPLMVTESEVYAMGERVGLWRLDRATGSATWNIRHGNGSIGYLPEATRVITVGPRVIYATDLANRLMVVDRQTGLRLGLLDTSGWVVPVLNNQTDRLYLAANDGSIACLRDRDSKGVFRHNPDDRKLEIKSRTLRKMLAELREKFGRTLSVSPRAFQSVGMEVPYDKEIMADDMAGLDISAQVRQLLRKIGCRIETVGGEEFVLPLRSVPLEAPPMEEKAPPAENAKPKEEKQ